MGIVNRRAVVMGAGLTGLTGLAAVGGRAGGGSPPGGPDPASLLRAIRLSGPAADAALARSGLGTAPMAALPPDAPTRPTQEVEGVAAERADPVGRVFARGLTFHCSPRVLNRLVVGGRPVVAGRVSFSVDQIGWAAGVGLPVYAAFCPRFEYAGGYYPAAKWHQLVPRLGNCYFTGCTASDVCAADQPGELAFDVNSDGSGAHAGGYSVTVWGWS